MSLDNNQIMNQTILKSDIKSVSQNTEKLTLSGFEGPEKLIDVCFTGQNAGSLRNVDFETWKAMLQIVQCQILSTIRNESTDAYLLSESSMFVFERRLVLKTCGTTTLLNAIPALFEIARECGLDQIESFFYSRKSFLFPDKQEWPHGRWNEEASYLDDLFPSAEYETSAYILGKINGDHWCLYTCTPILDSNGDLIDQGDVESLESNFENDNDIVTLEILMTGLDPKSMQKFWRTAEEKRLAKTPENVNALKHKFTGAEHRVFTSSGINKIYPNSIVDDYVFDPCGYSLNGLLEDYYYTIHVTPEDICSYASFETSVPVKQFREGMDHECFSEVIQSVVDIFKPSKFSTTLFIKHEASHQYNGLLNGHITGFRRRDAVIQSLGRWQLYFSHYDQSNK